MPASLAARAAGLPVKPTGKPLSLPGDHSGGAPGASGASLLARVNQRGNMLSLLEVEVDQKEKLAGMFWKGEEEERNTFHSSSVVPCSTVHWAKFRG